MIYAFFGLYSAKKRECVKYGAMFAENLIFSHENLWLPRSWFETIVLGYIVARRLNLPAHKALFLTLIKSTRKCMVNLDVMRQLVIRAFIESLSLSKIEVKELDRTLVWLGILDEPFRALHEVIYKFISKRITYWRVSVRILAILARYIVITRGRAKPSVVSRIFNLYKLQIPVLSPFAYP